MKDIIVVCYCKEKVSGVLLPSMMSGAGADKSCDCYRVNWCLNTFPLHLKARCAQVLAGCLTSEKKGLILPSGTSKLGFRLESK